VNRRNNKAPVTHGGFAFSYRRMMSAAAVRMTVLRSAWTGWRLRAARRSGWEAVVKAPSDGYTLLLVTVANVVNTTLYERLSFNFIRDIAPVASIDRVPNVMDVHPSFPVKTVPEFIAYAKANPAKSIWRRRAAGARSMLPASCSKWPPASICFTFLIAAARPRCGQVQVMFDTMQSSIEYIRAGKLRPIGGNHRDTIGRTAGHPNH
jgi:hypothetical protein